MANDSQALQAYLGRNDITDWLEKTLGKQKTQKAKSNLLTLWRDNSYLQNCTPKSIVGAAVLAATYELEISPQFGQAFVVPYKDKTGSWQAQFQLGWKGLYQLAIRTGKYQTIHAGRVFEGQIRDVDPFTGNIIRGEKISNNVVGYIAYFKLLNGFESSIYMTVDEIKEHAANFSQSYAYDIRNGKKTSVWSKNFDAMATKTVLKKLLVSRGILDTGLGEILQADQSDADKGTFTYVDNRGTVVRREETIIPDETPNADSPKQEAIDIEPVIDIGSDSDADPF